MGIYFTLPGTDAPSTPNKEYNFYNQKIFAWITEIEPIDVRSLGTWL
ncbi:hypothetical protein [Bacillus sp. XF8]|nr:hypothetical protein [Bacillus sp. XF8]MBO1581571.1 hypothetical protein [Bacillus sp. XF8]